MTNPNDVLPREVARDFGEELLQLAGLLPGDFRSDVIASLGAIAFKRALEIATEIDFGSEDVR